MREKRRDLISVTSYKMLTLSGNSFAHLLLNFCTCDCVLNREFSLTDSDEREKKNQCFN